MVEVEYDENGKGIGTVVLAATIIIVVVLAIGFYNAMAEPYHVADMLKDRLDDYGNVSDDYRQGYLDCVSNYLKIKTGPSNITTAIVIGDI